MDTETIEDDDISAQSNSISTSSRVRSILSMLMNSKTTEARLDMAKKLGTDDEVCSRSILLYIALYHLLLNSST